MISRKIAHRLELVVLVVLIIATFLILQEFEISEQIHQYSTEHEEYELDEIILTVAVSFLYLAIFALRRYVELLRIYRASITDPMVDALNRRGGVDAIERTHERAKDRDEKNCLILFDIDNFKSINDGYGHDVGDAVLTKVAKLAGLELRSTDQLIRWGGEEFLVLCHQTNIQDAARLAERIRSTFAETPYQDIGVVTASFGVAELRADQPLRQSIKTADQRLYLSKERGKNQVVWREPIANETGDLHA